MRSFDEMNRMFSEMDRMFDQMRSAWWNQTGMETGRPALGTDRPALETSRSAFDGPRSLEGFGGETAIDLADEGDEFVFVMDLPGFEREDIDLTFDEGLLSIRASRDAEEDSDGFRSMHSRRIGKQVSVPKEVVAEEITATYRNGVLEVHLPIVEGEQGETGHRIDID